MDKLAGSYATQSSPASAVRALALICDACLWVLLRRIGSDAQHILDVLPKMRIKTLEFSTQLQSARKG